MQSTVPVKSRFQVKVIQTNESYDADIQNKSTINNTSPSHDPAIYSQVSSRLWLRKHSLRASHLDSRSIFPQLGFLHLQEFDDLLKKTVESKYGESLFLKHQREDGKTMNIIAKRDTIVQIHDRLQTAITSYQQRLDWLQSGSRRMFGVIQERVVTIVVDIKTMSPREFDQAICVLERVLKEQLRHVAMFNLIRCCEGLPSYDTEPVAVNKDSIQLAIDWLWHLDRLAPNSISNTIEALLKASMSKQNEAIYLFTEGESSNHSREILQEQVKRLTVPMHIVLYNCVSDDWTTYLKSLCNFTGARFHAYSVAMAVESYEGLPIDHHTQRADIVVKKRLYGGVAPGSGIREDTVLIFEEMENARNLLDQINFLLQQIPDVKPGYEHHLAGDTKVVHERQEESMSSKEWLAKFGMKARKLDFFQVLKGVVFKHCDGVVTMTYPPAEESPPGQDWNEQLDAVRQPKLINAKYCDKFAHVRWKDGTVVHVQVTSDVYRLYEQRMQVALGAFRRRIDWLKQGSRELFGTIMEDQVYILLDTSASMQPSITLLKDKVYILLQEQLRHKAAINFIAFNKKAHPWKDRLEEVTESSIKAAWQWIRVQQCAGSTNTMAALKLALADAKTQGIYLLTDGRPDQDPKSILAQLQFHHKVPIHTISFNCADREANEFLRQLAKETNGRFHIYDDIDDRGEAWESEDIRLLKEEYSLGCQSLEKMAKLRDECFRLAWNKSTHEQPVVSALSRSKSHAASRAAGSSATVSRTRSNSHHHEQQQVSRSSARKTPLTRPKARNTFRREMEKRKEKSSGDTSMRFLSDLNKKKDSLTEDWILPETQALLDDQELRYQQTFKGDGEEHEEKEGAIKNAENNTNNLEAEETLVEESKEDLQLSLDSHRSVSSISIESPKQSKRRYSLTKWLKLNSLKKRKLTIFDVLGPCKLEHIKDYVPILDRHVGSQVFEEILPLRYFKRGHEIIVNPLGVDWSQYRRNVENAIQEYERRWVEEIRENVELKEIEDLLNCSLDDIHFSDHQKLILSTVESRNWPVNLEGLFLVTNEINKGKKFIEESVQLEKYQAVVKRKSSNDKNKRKQSVNASKKGNAASKRASVSSKTSLQAKNNPLHPTKFLRNKKIIAPFEEDGFYYEGILVRCLDLDIVEISLLDLNKKIRVHISQCVDLEDMRFQHVVGQHVFVRSYYKDFDKICFLPATVIDTDKTKSKVKLKLFTGIEHWTDTHQLVRITEAKYKAAVKLIIKKNLYKSNDSPSEAHPEKKSDHPANASNRPASAASSTAAIKERLIKQEEKLSSIEQTMGSQMELLRQSHEMLQESLSKRIQEDKKQDDLLEIKSKVELLNVVLQEMKQDRKHLNDSSGSSSRPLSPVGSLASTSVPLDLEDTQPSSNSQSKPSVKGSMLIGQKVVAELGETLQFCKGVVIAMHGSSDNEYFEIRDKNGRTFRSIFPSIFAEQLNAEEHDTLNGITVLAPKQAQSLDYLPAVVVRAFSEDLVTLRFWDSQEENVSKKKCFQIPNETFELIIRRKKSQEHAMWGAKVITRNDRSGVFMHGTLLSRVKGKQNQFNILLANGEVIQQKSLHIFYYGVLLKLPIDGERVLARFNGSIFLPGWIVHFNENKMSAEVHFFHGEKCTVAVQDIVPIKTEYYSLLLQHMRGQRYFP